MTNQPPTSPIIRLRDIVDWLDVPQETVLKWVECDIIHPIHPNPNGKAYYRTEEICEKILMMKGNGK